MADIAINKVKRRLSHERGYTNPEMNAQIVDILRTGGAEHVYAARRIEELEAEVKRLRCDSDTLKKLIRADRELMQADAETIKQLRELVLTPGQFRALADFILRRGELTNGQGLTALILRNMADDAEAVSPPASTE